MFNEREQAIIGKAGAALTRKCGFDGVSVKRLTGGSAYQLSDRTGTVKGPMIHTGGEIISEEETYGNGDVCILLQFRHGSLARAEVRSREKFKEACQEWASTVKSELPEIEIVFLKLEN